MYKKIALGLLCLLAFASKTHADCFARTNPVNFTANLTKEHSDNAYLQLVSQTIAVSAPQPIDSCSSGSGPSTFTMSGVTDLMTSNTISKDGYTYYQIPPTNITPASPNMKVYIAFSVKDNQNTATEHWVNSPTNSYELFNGYSVTRGLRLQNIRLLVSGLGNSAGVYTISNLRLGSFSASDRWLIWGATASTSIRLNTMTFQVK